MADQHPDAGKPFRPSTGTEGACFFDDWCCHCQRDKAMREGADFDECDDNEKCELIANSMAFDIGHPRYPVEWIHDRNGRPCCTAFLDARDPVTQVIRDTRTIDMFGGTA